MRCRLGKVGWVGWTALPYILFRQATHTHIDSNTLADCHNCAVALFLNQQFLKMASISTFLLGILPKDQELEKVIWPNIALSTRTGPHTLYNVDYNGAIFQKSFSGNNFWLECPTDLRSTPLSYIFDALFRDTPLGHVCRTQPNSQIAKLAKYRDIWLIWP